MIENTQLHTILLLLPVTFAKSIINAPKQACNGMHDYHHVAKLKIMSSTPTKPCPLMPYFQTHRLGLITNVGKELKKWLA